MQLSDLIRQKRKALGMTQRELAIRMGVNKSAVAQWELYNTRPTSENMALLARLLDITDTIEPPPGEPYRGEIVDDPDELAWLAFWRALGRDERTTVLKLLNVGAPEARKLG